MVAAAWLAAEGCTEANLDRPPTVDDDLVTVMPDAPSDTSDATVLPVPIEVVLESHIAYPGPGASNLVAAAQLSADGLMDIVLVGADRGFVYLGGSDQRFSFPVGFSNRRALVNLLADVIEGDAGKVELVSFSPGVLSARRPSDGGELDGSVAIETETGLLCTSVSAGFVGQDEHLDFIGRCAPYPTNGRAWRVQVFEGRGDGRFDLTTAIPMQREDVERAGPLPDSVAAFDELRVGDVNEDGYSDLVLGTFTGSEATLLLGSAEGRFTPGEPIDTREGLWALLLEDVDGDAHLDLVSVSNLAVHRMLGRGDGTFETPQSVPCRLESCTSVSTGDVDSDGVRDLLLGSRYQSAIAVATGGSLAFSVYDLAAACPMPIWLGDGRLACSGERLQVYGVAGTPPTSTVCADQPSDVDCLAAGCAGLVWTSVASFDPNWPGSDRVTSGCARASWDKVCVPKFGVPSTVATTFYRAMGDQLVFAPGGLTSEGISVLAPSGDDWTECGSLGAPETCGCFCVQGVCPGQHEVDIMESCGAPEPCPVLRLNSATFADSACVRGALQAGQPAMLRVSGYFGGPTIEDWFLVGITGIFWSRRLDDAACGGGCQSWSPVSDRCQPVAAAPIDACITLADETVGCLDPANWLKDCEPATPVCGE